MDALRSPLVLRGPAPSPSRRLRAAAPAPSRPLRLARPVAAKGTERNNMDAVESVLSQNAALLSSAVLQSSLPAASEPQEVADAAALFTTLVEEERRLAALEAELARAEGGLSVLDRSLLLQQAQAQQPPPQSLSLSLSEEMQARLESTEAEAAVRGPPRSSSLSPAGRLLPPPPRPARHSAASHPPSLRTCTAAAPPRCQHPHCAR